MNKYSDIINYNYQMKHDRMSIRNRSAQFAPFSALTGFSDLILEKGRETIDKINLSEDVKNVLDMKLSLLNQKISSKPNVEITYFIKDTKKNGGNYNTITEIIKRIDFTKHFIVLSNNLKIKIDDILEIDSQDINFNDII